MKTVKTRLKCLAVLTSVLASGLQAPAQGHIVANGIVVNFWGLFAAGEIDVLHDPANPSEGGSYTGFSLVPKAKTQPTVYTNTFLFSPVVDVGVRVFLVPLDKPIDLQSILGNTYTELVSPNNDVFNAGVPFYVGLYTGNQSFAPLAGIYDDPLFGWAELENVGGTIQLLNSALEYQGGGIYAGTQNLIPVPEPSTVSFGALGLGVFLVCSWRWKAIRHRAKCG